MLATVVPGALLSTVLTAWHYSSKPMWRDEWFTYGTAERSLPQMARLLSESDGGLVGFYLFTHAWMSFGDSLAWVRLPAAIATVVLTALTALVGRRLGGPLVGALSGLIVAVLPSVTDHAQEARAYPLVIAATVATALAALRYRETASRQRGVVLAVLAVVAVVTHPLPGAPAVAGIVLGLLRAPGDARRSRVVLLAAPAGAAALALVAWGASQGGGSSNPGGLRSLGFMLTLRFAVAPTWALLVVLLLLSSVGALALVGSRRGESVLVLAWIAVPVATITASIFAGSFSEARYLSAVVPAAAVLAAAGSVAVGRAIAAVLVRRPGHDARYAPWVGPVTATVLTAAVVLAYLPGVAELRQSPYMKDDLRGASAYLTAESRPGDGVVYSGTTARGMTENYSPEVAARLDDVLLAVAPLPAGSIRGTEISAAERPTAATDNSRIWVIGARSTSGWRSQEAVDDLTAGFQLRAQESFGSWFIERWDRSDLAAQDEESS